MLLGQIVRGAFHQSVLPRVMRVTEVELIDGVCWFTGVDCGLNVMTGAYVSRSETEVRRSLEPDRLVEVIAYPLDES